MSNSTLRECPKCQADLGRLGAEFSRLAFCYRCRFPIKLLLKRYRLLREIGRGGFGVVYLAEHLDLRLPRAVKILNETPFQNQEFEEVYKRFQREIRVTGALAEGNDHIVRIYDTGEDSELGAFYVMEYLEGLNLRQLLQIDPLLDLGLVGYLFGQISDAVGWAHRQGIVHRDLKPENFFVIRRGDNQGYVKLLDFGIAKVLQGTVHPHLTQGILGSPAYMAPEQWMGEAIEAPADVYSLGAVLYEMLTGKPPFVSQNPHEMMKAHLDWPPERPTLRRGGLELPVPVEDAILRSLAKAPADRFPDAQAFWEALQPHLPAVMPGDWKLPLTSDSSQTSVISLSPLQHRWQEEIGKTSPNLQKRSSYRDLAEEDSTVVDLDEDDRPIWATPPKKERLPTSAELISFQRDGEKGHSPAQDGPSTDPEVEPLDSIPPEAPKTEETIAPPPSFFENPLASKTPRPPPSPPDPLPSVESLESVSPQKFRPPEEPPHEQESEKARFPRKFFLFLFLLYILGLVIWLGLTRPWEAEPPPPPPSPGSPQPSTPSLPRLTPRDPPRPLPSSRPLPSVSPFLPPRPSPPTSSPSTPRLVSPSSPSSSESPPSSNPVISAAPAPPFPEATHAGQRVPIPYLPDAWAVFVPPGRFLMGGGVPKKAILSDPPTALPLAEMFFPLGEQPPTQVLFSQGFWMMDAKVTQAQYAALMGRNPASFRACGPHCPIEHVSWDEALAFAVELSLKHSHTPCFACERADFLGQCNWQKPQDPEGSFRSCRTWRLPTEAEWEYAARAGDWYPYVRNSENIGWFSNNIPALPYKYRPCYVSRGTDHKGVCVGVMPGRLKRPNAWGLYDMIGNLREWTLNSHTRWYPGGTIENFFFEEQKALKVLRGVSWSSPSRFLIKRPHLAQEEAFHVRYGSRDTAARTGRSHAIGFRLILPLAPSF